MKYLILGGTGTLGRELAARLLIAPSAKVVVFSRDELKQKNMSAEFKNPRLSFVIGDIRDASAVARVMPGVHTAFHVAALKHIDVAQDNPEESVKTNILGTINVADAAEAARVPYVVFSSTDKACEPINVYGMSKGISERILLNRNSIQEWTHFSVFRWGNVLGSRGSVIHHFAKTLKEEKKAYITHPEMTRFWIKIADAVSFMLANYQEATEIMVPPIRCASVISLIDATAAILGVGRAHLDMVGRRPGEKMHESLLPGMRSDNWANYSQEELQDMIRPIVEARQ